ncbi:MAG: helix-turn-helix transcriptional regulator [Aureispira sp.]
MLAIPQRLFEHPQVQILLRDTSCCILHKQLDAPLLKRTGYVSKHVLGMVLAGTQHLQTYEGERITIQAGQGILLPSSMYVISDLLPQQGNFESILFYFDNALIHEFIQERATVNTWKAVEIRQWRFDSTFRLQEWIKQLQQFYTTNTAHPALARLKIKEYWHWLCEELSEKQLLEQLFALTLPKKRQLGEFMEANFDKPLKVEDYAQLTGRSLSSFRRDCQQLLGESPQKWLRAKRLTKAKSLLLEEQPSVTALAHATGYDNVSYFIRAFKAQYGLSPKQYLLQHLQ